MRTTEVTAATATLDEEHQALWKGDKGTLRESSRRVLLELLRGPYVSGERMPKLWGALVADQAAIESHLHDLFLDLVIDQVDELAYTRKVATDELDVPSALRKERLTYLDTVMFLVLRQLLLATPGERRVIVGQEEVFDHLQIYRQTDEVTFIRNLNSSWKRMRDKFRVLHKVGEGRFEVSPLVKTLIDEDRIRELVRIYSETGRPL